MNLNFHSSKINFDTTDSDYNSDVSGNIFNVDNEAATPLNVQTTTEDILKNGILVETEDGVVCMSLRDVPTSSLNLSVEDIKSVAAQLLSQENHNESDSKIDPGQIDSTDQFVNLSNSSNNINNDNNLLVVTSTDSNLSVLTNIKSNELLLNNYDAFQSTSTATSEAVDTSEETDKEKGTVIEIPPLKRRGGWPKGRKRKPELLHLPPKAPKTCYTIFLNERRKLYKDKLAFHEITRVVGNQWSNLTPDEKKPYIEKAEEDKKRYREELQAYRRSDAYRLYLAGRIKKRITDNLWSESDMDGTDDIDDEDDMLYCDVCDQWFYNLHNKREHMLSRQHKITEAGNMSKNMNSDGECKSHVSSVSFSTSLDESSMDAPSVVASTSKSSTVAKKSQQKTTDDVTDNMVRLIKSVTEREKEIQILQSRIGESKRKQNSLVSELNMLKTKSKLLQSNLMELKNEESSLETQLFRLWNVPSLFVIDNVKLY